MGAIELILISSLKIAPLNVVILVEAPYSLYCSIPVAAGLGPFCPGIAVAVQRNAGDSQAAASPSKFGRPMGFPHGAKFGEKRPGAGKFPQDAFKFVAEAND